jgi:hypothetical protein
MPISDSLRDLLGDPRSAAMLRDRAERGWTRRSSP